MHSTVVSLNGVHIKMVTLLKILHFFTIILDRYKITNFELSRNFRSSDFSKQIIIDGNIIRWCNKKNNCPYFSNQKKFVT